MKITPESRVLIADCETNGFLEHLDKLTLLTYGWLDDDLVRCFRQDGYNGQDATIAMGLEVIAEEASKGAIITFHNAIRFDVPAIKKVYPWFDMPPSQLYDSLVWLRLKYPDVYNQVDAPLIRSGRLKKAFARPHSLEAWGQRVGEYKGEYEGDTRIEDSEVRKATKWDNWNPDLERYGIQDIVTLRAVLRATKPWEYSPVAQELEHKVAHIIERQIKRGQAFDEKAASSLYATLKGEYDALHSELVSSVGGFWFRKGDTFVPKRPNKTLGYVKDAPLSPVEFREFNPTSRQHIARFLKDKYDWHPMSFTDGGDPQIDGDTLETMEYPEAAKLSRLFLLDKRIGMLAEGKQGYLKVSKNGLIHGDVMTNGAVTGRMTHMRPNLGQVPRVGSEYGLEFRSLFGARKGYIRGGIDAEGLELRMLAHYMWPYDDGAYANAVVNGSSDEETDVHSLNTKAIGLEPKKLYTIGGKSSKGRDFGKTFIYAFLYGAGPPKLGSILGKGPDAGRKLRTSFLRKTPALAMLIDRVSKAVKKSGHLKGLDGRRIPVRSAHAALNTLLQGGGAAVMKVFLVLFDEALQAAGYVPGDDYEFVANVHDEVQMEVREHLAEAIGDIAMYCMVEAGNQLGVRCPMAGKWKTGLTWADTH